MLNKESGIDLYPGSKFEENEHNYHLWMTSLSTSLDELNFSLEKFKNFTEKIMNEY